MTEVTELTPGASSARDKRNQLTFMSACILWVVLFIGSLALLDGALVLTTALRWMIAAVPAVAAALVLGSAFRYMRETDELQRTIQLQAGAIGFAAGLFAIMSNPILDQLDVPATSPARLAVVMTIMYALGNLIGRIRHRRPRVAESRR